MLAFAAADCLFAAPRCLLALAAAVGTFAALLIAAAVIAAAAVDAAARRVCCWAIFLDDAPNFYCYPSFSDRLWLPKARKLKRMSRFVMLFLVGCSQVLHEKM